MVTFAQLRDAKLEPIAEAVTTWTRLAKQLETAEDTYNYKLLKPLGDSQWQGNDSKLAYAKMYPITQQMRVSATEASAIASVLHTGHGKFKAAQDKLKQAIASAEGLYLKVGNDGSLTPPKPLPQGYTTDQYRLEMNKIHSRFEAVVKEATQADSQISKALAQMDVGVLKSRRPLVNAGKDAGLATRLAGFNPSNIPPPGVKTPKQVADWWKSLPEEQRHLMMNAYPKKIGWLNGIPSEDRDEANRTRLANRMAYLQSKSASERIPFEERDLKRLTEFQEKMSKYEGMGYDLYVLGLDSETPGHKDELRETDLGRNEIEYTDGPDGRAIVAFGNPDMAQHTAIKVPGTGSELDTFRRDLRHVAGLYDAAGSLGRGSVSTIAWFDYDAPDNLRDAGYDSYFETGAPRLGSFIDGVNANQTVEQGSRQHTTLIGHSYGSTVVGELAANDNNMHERVDDIIAVGSPGMNVNEATDLNVGKGHVWSLEAEGDIVPEMGAPKHGDFEGPEFGTEHDSVDGPGYVVPSDREFGGNEMTSNTTGHSDYWSTEEHEDEKWEVGGKYEGEDANDALFNQANVVTGNYGGVKLEWGHPPR